MRTLVLTSAIYVRSSRKNGKGALAISIMILSPGVKGMPTALARSFELVVGGVMIVNLSLFCGNSVSVPYGQISTESQIIFFAKY